MRTRQIIRYRATATLRRPQIKQYTASNAGATKPTGTSYYFDFDVMYVLKMMEKDVRNLLKNLILNRTIFKKGLTHKIQCYKNNRFSKFEYHKHFIEVMYQLYSFSSINYPFGMT